MIAIETGVGDWWPVLKLAAQGIGLFLLAWLSIASFLRALQGGIKLWAVSLWLTILTVVWLFILL